MCLRALCTMLETDSLEIGTVAVGSVSFDSAELMSLFSTRKERQIFTIISYWIHCVDGTQHLSLLCGVRGADKHQ